MLSHLRAAIEERTSPSVEALVAETERLLGTFYRLSPSEMQRLARNLEAIANYAERQVERESRGGEGDQRT